MDGKIIRNSYFVYYNEVTYKQFFLKYEITELPHVFSNRSIKSYDRVPAD